MAKLTAKRRSERGTRQSRRLRKQGLIPGIVYGHGEEPLAITISEHEVELALLHGERVVEVAVEGQTLNALVKDVQWDTFGHEVLHVDLARVNLDEVIEVEVTVVLTGTPAGVKEGGMLQQVLDVAEVQCTARAIPEEIRVPVTELEIGDRLTVSDLKPPEGARLLADPDELVCQVVMVAEEEEEEAVEAEGAGEPEVIGEKGEEEPEAAPGEA
jgi:large subunit ribosomal protein L25